MESIENSRSTNFRFSLINKCFKDGGVESDGDILQQILQSKTDIDIWKLKTVAWKLCILHSYRCQCYRYLLGISSAYTESRDVIEKHREEEAHVLLKCLQTMRIYEGTIENDKLMPTSWDIVQMILILRRELPIEKIKSLKNIENNLVVSTVKAIVRCIDLLCHDDWMNLFHISRELINTLDETFHPVKLSQTIAEIREEVESRLGMEPEEFLIFMNDFSLELILKTGCCEILHSEKAIFKVLDKVCTKQAFVPLLRDLIIEYITHVDRVQRTASITKVRNRQLSRDDEIKLVNAAIDAAINEKGSSRSTQKSSNASLIENNYSSSISNLNAAL
ncbi:unnamed protein product [Auanema sp. JU1783]|nr:unnamed protein product [Auanema sp. JU1783]